MIDYADKSYLQKPLPASHDDKRAAAREYLRRRRISVMLPPAKCRLNYVPSEHGSRVLKAFTANKLKAAA